MDMLEPDLWSRHLRAWIRRRGDDELPSENRDEGVCGFVQSPHEGFPWLQEAVADGAAATPRGDLNAARAGLD
jgi:hypothetical protein